MTNKNRRRRRMSSTHDSVLSEQTPTKATKALVAAVVTFMGLLGIHVTTGTAQLVVMGLQLLLVFYGVWRARNAPKAPGRPGMGDFL